MDKAEGLTHNGSFEEAISALDEALNIEPENETVLIRKAWYLSVVGMANESAKEYERALSFLDEDLKKNASDAEAWEKKASALNSLNRNE